MTAGRTAPDYGLFAPCFQSIRQLLPTFKQSAWSGRLTQDTPCTLMQLRCRCQAFNPSQNEGDMGWIGTMLADLAVPCTKYLREYRSAEY
jgi:hypothetical protein